MQNDRKRQPEPAPVTVVVEARLDNPRSGDLRFLQEAARFGPLHVRVPSDALVVEHTGAAPMFPAAERLFLAESFRWVDSAAIVGRSVAADMDELALRHAVLVSPGRGPGWRGPEPRPARAASGSGW